VQRPEGWTDREERACEFGGATDALFYCYNHHLTDMRILGQFEDPRQNFNIALSENRFEQVGNG